MKNCFGKHEGVSKNIEGHVIESDNTNNNNKLGKCSTNVFLKIGSKKKERKKIGSKEKQSNTIVTK